MLFVAAGGAALTRYYHQRFSWIDCWGTQLIVHDDLGVSCALALRGVDQLLQSEEDKNQAHKRYCSLINLLPESVTAEFHLWRMPDSEQLNVYKRTPLVRNEKLGSFFREKMAAHLEGKLYSNQILLVLRQGSSQVSWWRARRSVHYWQQAAESLLALAHQISEQWDGKLLDAETYLFWIRRTLRFDQPADDSVNSSVNLWQANPRLLLREQLVDCKPTLDTHGITLHAHHQRVHVLSSHPEAVSCMLGDWLMLPVRLHCVTVVNKMMRAGYMRRSEIRENVIAGTRTHLGGELQLLQTRSERAFRLHVLEHNLEVFRNYTAISLYAQSTEELLKLSDALQRKIREDGGTCRYDQHIQLPYYRYCQPGLGYQSRWWRVDHTEQVAHLLPIEVFERGDSPQMIRSGMGGQPVGLRYDTDAVNHSLTVAATGAGKGVEAIASIIETFPLGFDWLILEVGETYRWVVEAFGGVYITLDPDEMVINPLPDYEAAQYDPQTQQRRLPLQLENGVLDALSWILTQDSVLSVHERAAASAAFVSLYQHEGQEKHLQKQPTFALLLKHMQKVADDLGNKQQYEALMGMSERLDSFLHTAEGKVFNQPENIAIDSHLCAVNFLTIRNKAEGMVRFFLVFLAIRFMQRAFLSAQPTRILLDELHYFVAAAPDVIGPLTSGMARMGRKQGAAIELITQGVTEIDQIDSEVILQIPNQNLLYRQGDHDQVARRLNMPEPVKQFWSEFETFEGRHPRQCIKRAQGRYHALRLDFPTELVLMAETSPRFLEAKSEIEKTITDPITRLEELRCKQQQWQK